MYGQHEESGLRAIETEDLLWKGLKQGCRAIFFLSNGSQQRLLCVRAFLPTASLLEDGRWRIARVLGLLG